MAGRNKDTLYHAAKLVLRETRRRIAEGKSKTFTGPKGMLALMMDKIERYHATLGQSEIIELAVDSLLLVSLMLEHIMQEANNVERDQAD